MYSGPVSAPERATLDVALWEEIGGPWTVSVNGDPEKELMQLTDLAGREMDPCFSGKAVYKKRVTFTRPPASLSLGRVEEACRVWLDGRFSGSAVTAPYVFEVPKDVLAGEHLITVETVSNAAHSRSVGMQVFADSLAAHAHNALRPCGLLGPAAVVYTACPADSMTPAWQETDSR